MKSIRILFAATILVLTNAEWAAAAELFRPFAYIEYGPEKALGAIIWSHGKARRAESKDVRGPRYLSRLNFPARWDVFRLKRTWSSDRVYDSTRDLATAIEEVRRKGYERVVLAGQSYGAWISINAARSADDIHGVIGLAPAAHGSWKSNLSGYDKNASQLFSMLSRIHPTRVFLAFFKDDKFDPGGRGERSGQILTERGIPNVILDEPEGFCGHGAGNGWAFDQWYGSCLEGFLDPQTKMADFSCETGLKYPPSQRC